MTQPTHYRVSQWLKIPVLLDYSEMEAFIQSFPTCQFYQVGVVRPKAKNQPTKEEFLQAYQSYISSLCSGKIPDPEQYKDFFACAFSDSPDDFAVVDLPQDRSVWRLARPVIQFQEHRVDFSSHDHEFRSKVLGPNSIFWGVMISYPQLFENPVNRQADKVLNNPDYPNGGYFRAMQRWMRQNTLATPFIVEGKRKNVPIRLGKNCFSWINQHPQLIEKGISVDII